MNSKPYVWEVVLILLMLIVSGCETATTEPISVPSKTAVDMSEATSTTEVPVEETPEATPTTQAPVEETPEATPTTQIAVKAPPKAIPTVEVPFEETPEAIPTLQVPGSVPTKAGDDKIPAVVYKGISFSYDPAIASDVMTELVPAADREALGWSLGPTHVRFSFGDYVLPDTLYRPRILVYPVAEFEAISKYAAKTIADLRQLLVDRPAAPQAIPFLPPFNAEQVMRAQVAYVDFRDGAGVRSLVHYAQARVPVSNYELFYTFQRLTDDGNAYVAAILPVSHPDLPENYMDYDLDTFARTYDTYLVEIEKQLNEQDASSFSPKLSQLDAMIQSLKVGSPWPPRMPPATEGQDDPYPGWARYANACYEFAFRYPTTWTLREKAGFVSLSQGTLQLSIAYRRRGEDFATHWTGMPAGDFESRGTMSFLGQEIDKRSLVYEGKVKVLSYRSAEGGDIEFSIRFDDMSSIGYETIELSEAMQNLVDQILGSFEWWEDE